MKHQSTLAIFTTLVVITTLLLTACGSAPNKEPIKIGWIGALTGGSASAGKWDTHGVELVIDETNTKGGVCGGRLLQLIKYDDAADTTKSLDAAQKLVNEDKVIFAFATTNSNTSLADVPVFTKAKVGQMSGALSADLTTKGSAYVFRNIGAGPAFESTLVDYLVKKGFTKFAIISDSAAYGKGEADYQQAALRNNKLESVLREAYDVADKDFTQQIKRIIATNAEVLLLGGTAVPSGQIAIQARELGFKGQIAGGNSIGTPQFIEIAKEAAEGVIFSSPYIDNDLNDTTKDFAKRYKAKWGYDAENHGAKAYDGAMIAVEAIKRSCNNLTAEEVAKQVHATKDYQGVQGKFTYQENGEGISQVQVGVIKGGQMAILRD